MKNYRCFVKLCFSGVFVLGAVKASPLGRGVTHSVTERGVGYVLPLSVCFAASSPYRESLAERCRNHTTQTKILSSSDTAGEALILPQKILCNLVHGNTDFFAAVDEAKIDVKNTKVFIDYLYFHIKLEVTYPRS